MIIRTNSKSKELIHIEVTLLDNGDLLYMIYPIIYYQQKPYILYLPMYSDVMNTWKWKRKNYEYVLGFKKVIWSTVNKKNYSTITINGGHVNIKYKIFGFFKGTFEYNPDSNYMRFVYRDRYNEVHKYYLREKNGTTFVDDAENEYTIKPILTYR